MEQIYEIAEGNVLLHTGMPILGVSEIQVKCKENSHGKIIVKGIFAPDSHEKVLEKDWTGAPIVLINKDADNKVVFSGNLESMVCEMQGGVLSFVLYGADHTIDFDRKKKKRSFQNTGMLYREVCLEVADSYQKAQIRWNVKEEKQIGEPIIQYEETDWAFLMRVSSHLHQPVIADSASAGAVVQIGLPQGEQRNADDVEILRIGIEETYYRNGCFASGQPKDAAFYIDIKSREDWNIGDSYRYEGNTYCVYRKTAKYMHGEFVFQYRLGKDKVFYREKQYNLQLRGCRLEGTIRGIQEESVYLQLDIDEDERADYPWPWAPETNNLSYCMPEIGTKATLCFATEEEKDAQVVCAVVHNEQMDQYTNTQQREFHTAYSKKLELYEDKLFLEGKDRTSFWEIMDEAGMKIQTCHQLSLCAEGTVNCITPKLSIQSPVELTCMTKQANIELCRDINLYAANGVNTIGTGERSVKKPEEETEGEGYSETKGNWKESFTALAAIPAVEMGQAGSEATVTALYACGGIPRVAAGAAVLSLSQVMNGTKEEDCMFPNVFQSMEGYTVKGGYAVPKGE